MKHRLSKEALAKEWDVPEEILTAPFETLAALFTIQTGGGVDEGTRHPDTVLAVARTLYHLHDALEPFDDCGYRTYRLKENA